MDATPSSAPPTITAELEDGPLEGMRVEASVVEGRPPKTVEVEAGGEMLRYVLSEWTQAGPSATYSFLYRV